MTMSLREFCRQYREGRFLSPDLITQIQAGWEDWFCCETQLPDRLAKIWEVLDGVTNDYILDNYHVRFKNNRPVYNDVHPLYDDILFEPLNRTQERRLSFGIDIDDKRRAHKYNVITARNGYKTEFVFDNLSEVQAFINSWENISKSDFE